MCTLTHTDREAERTWNGINSGFCYPQQRPNCSVSLRTLRISVVSFRHNGNLHTHTTRHAYRQSRVSWQDSPDGCLLILRTRKSSTIDDGMANCFIWFSSLSNRVNEFFYFCGWFNSNSTRTGFPNREQSHEQYEIIGLTIENWHASGRFRYETFALEIFIFRFSSKFSPFSSCLGWWLMTLWRSRVCSYLTLILSMLVHGIESDKKFWFLKQVWEDFKPRRRFESHK